MPRGGSTISMQVVKNLFLWPSRSYVRKALDIPLAYAIEAGLAQAAHPGDLPEHRRMGAGHLRRGGGGALPLQEIRPLLTPREAALLAVSLPNPFERQAGRPGPGTLRLADNLHAAHDGGPGQHGLHAQAAADMAARPPAAGHGEVSGHVPEMPL